MHLCIKLTYFIATSLEPCKTVVISETLLFDPKVTKSLNYRVNVLGTQNIQFSNLTSFASVECQQTISIEIYIHRSSIDS